MTEVFPVTLILQPGCLLQGCGEIHCTLLILSFILQRTLLLLAFEVELEEFISDDWQWLSLGLRQEESNVQRRQQADQCERHKAEPAQPSLWRKVKWKLSDWCVWQDLNRVICVSEYVNFKSEGASVNIHIIVKALMKIEVE